MAADGTSSTKKYWIICLILFILTGAEFGIYEMESLRTNAAVMYPVIGGLSLIKFFLVCGYYMHLKDDHKLLTWIFVSGAVMALLVMIIYVMSMLADTSIV